MKTTRLLRFASAIACVAVLTACTPKLTQEQYNQLMTMKREEGQKREAIAKVEQDIARLEPELKARQADVKECEDRKAGVQSRLATWPNVWPDWAPPAPQDTTKAAPEPVKDVKAKKKK
jgi:septal ring factor EnvC (AmiA/AmiB activator)